MKPINYGEIIEKAEARRAALEAITPKLQAIHNQWGVLCAAAHRISSVNAEYKQLDSEATALLAQSVGVTEPTLRKGLWHLGQVVRQPDPQVRELLEALQSGEKAQKLTPLQAQVAAHYQGGEFGHIETQDVAQNVGDGLFTFCINEAGDASDKSELVAMLNRAISQLCSLEGALEGLEERACMKAHLVGCAEKAECNPNDAP